MSDKTAVGHIISAVTSPIGIATAGVTAGPMAAEGLFGISKAREAINKPGPTPPPMPVPPSPIDQASAEFAAEQNQAKPQGRAANILSGPSGSLLSPQNLYSASKQLLGS